MSLVEDIYNYMLLLFMCDCAINGSCPTEPKL